MFYSSSTFFALYVCYRMCPNTIPFHIPYMGQLGSSMWFKVKLLLCLIFQEALFFIATIHIEDVIEIRSFIIPPK